jgi:hypothetical protein
MSTVNISLLKDIDKAAGRLCVILGVIYILKRIYDVYSAMDQYIVQRQQCKPLQDELSQQFFEQWFHVMCYLILMLFVGARLNAAEIATQFGLIQCIVSIPSRLVMYYVKNIQISLFGTREEIDRIYANLTGIGSQWLNKYEFIGRIAILFFPLEFFVE